MLFDLAELQRVHSLKIDGVLHLGAHTGEEARAYHRGRCGPVWWVEADPEVMPALEAHLARWPDQHAINACVAAEPYINVVFHRANNHQSSSLLALGTHLVQSPDVHYVTDLLLDATTVDLLARDYGVKANFLNADLQGGELNALTGAEAFMRGVDYAYMEVNWEPLYVGCGLIEDVDELMAVYGFTRYDTKMAGNSGWGDAFYARPEALGLR
jgi:FkbM family methyltransferase